MDNGYPQAISHNSSGMSNIRPLRNMLLNNLTGWGPWPLLLMWSNYNPNMDK